jgi:hypothetical protein
MLLHFSATLPSSTSLPSCTMSHHADAVTHAQVKAAAAADAQSPNVAVVLL